VDRVELRCWLDWWANSSTVLASVDAIVSVESRADGWRADGRLVSADREEHEAFAFLCALDPVFCLRFADGSTVTVTVR
jgi:hypothetical protein